MSEWLESLPEPLREAPFLAKAESAEDAVQKLAHAAKLVGTSVRIPDSTASEDDRNAFYEKLTEIEGVTRLPTHDDEEGYAKLMTKLGRPEEYTEYALPDIEGHDWAEDTGVNLRKYALDAGLTKKQFEVMAAKIAEQEKTNAMASGQVLEDARKALRTDWGDTLEEREGLIRGWLQHAEAPETLRKGFEDKHLDVPTMKWLHSIAKQFQGDVKPISEDGKDAEVLLDPAEAHAKIRSILGDMVGMSEIDPRYLALRQQLVTAQRLASGGK